ncbi:MAG: hypothetical protein ACI4TE_05825 [Alphaproteobacteria bacterium]
MTTSRDYTPTIKLSANTLDNYAAAAGRKYMNISSRIKQKVKSVSVLDKIVKNVKAWDQKMTERHGAAYKFAKGAVIGTSIGVGLAVAGAEVATAYAAINAVRAAGNLLVQAEKSRQEGKSTGFSDFAAKNKMAVGLAAVSIGMSAAGVTAGVIENQVAVSVISSARQAAVGGMMATSTAAKINKINSEQKDGKITAEQANQAKKEQYAELAGNLTGLLAVSEISSQINTNAGSDNQAQSQTPAPDQVIRPETALSPTAEQIYDGGSLPEVTVTAPAPDRIYDGGVLPEAVITAPAPEHTPQPEAPVIPRADLPPQPAPVLPEIRTPADQRPINVEKDTYVSYTQTVSPTANTVSLGISDNNYTANSYNDSSLFVKVQDIKGSEAKLMLMSVHDDGRYSEIPTMHIDADGKVTQLPDWHDIPDANGDCHLSEREIQNWAAKRQASLQTVLSEQEAHNVVMTELNEEAKLYNGDNIYAVKSEKNTGTTRYDGPADGLNKGGENAADRVRDIGSQQADKIADSAREIMCGRIDAQGNACQVSATEKQIQIADILLRSAANKVR